VSSKTDGPDEGFLLLDWLFLLRIELECSADPNLSGGRRRNVQISRQSDPSKDQGCEAVNRGPVGAFHRADPTGSAVHHSFVGGMRTSIEEEDESLEL